MSKLKLYVCLLAVWFLLISSFMLDEPNETGDRNRPSLSENPVKGRHILASKGCLECHSMWGVGGKQGPDLAGVGMGKSMAEIAGSLWSHKPYATELTEQRDASLPIILPEEMSDLISYLYYLNYFNEPGDEIAGRELFSEKGCIKCHSIVSQGGNIGPPLDKFKSAASTLSIAQAMWNHSPDMVARMADLDINKPYFKQKEMANLLAFIRSQAADSVPDEKFLLPGSPLFGQRLFVEKNCIRCHSIYGKGGRIGPDLSRKGYYESGASIVGAMWNHDSLMSLKAQEAGTSRPTFSKSEMADIIAYLYFVRSTDIAGDSSAGKRLFEQKGCTQCHSTRQGEQVGPDLSTSDASISPVKLASAMWNHVPVAGRLMQERGLRWPTFKGDEMGDLIAYLKSIARRSTDQAIGLRDRRQQSK